MSLTELNGPIRTDGNLIKGLHNTGLEVCAEAADRIEALHLALVKAERALRDQPMQAFRTHEARHRRAKAIDAAQDALEMR